MDMDGPDNLLHVTFHFINRSFKGQGHPLTGKCHPNLAKKHQVFKSGTSMINDLPAALSRHLATTLALEITYLH